jgi:hypothetical protein
MGKREANASFFSSDILLFCVYHETIDLHY